jgi:hypothetical protein
VSDAGVYGGRLMTDPEAFGRMGVEEKREYLAVLADVIWDIEWELARAKSERADLSISLQADIRQGAA